MPRPNPEVGERNVAALQPEWRGEDSAAHGPWPALDRRQAQRLVAVLELLLDQIWSGEHRWTDPLEVACRLKAVRRRIDGARCWRIDSWLEVRRRLLRLVADLGDAHTVLELPRLAFHGAMSREAEEADPATAIWTLPIELTEREGRPVVA